MSLNLFILQCSIYFVKSNICVSTLLTKYILWFFISGAQILWTRENWLESWLNLMPLSLLNFLEELQVSLHTHFPYRLFEFIDQWQGVRTGICQWGSSNRQLKKHEGLGLTFLRILTLEPSLYPQSKYPFVGLINLKGHFIFIIYFTASSTTSVVSSSGDFRFRVVTIFYFDLFFVLPRAFSILLNTQRH